MNAVFIGGMRRRALGWMHPSVRKVGGVAGGMVAVDGGVRGVGDAPGTGIGIATGRAGVEPCGDARCCSAERGAKKNHHANPRAWSYGERWRERDFGAAVVWVILRVWRRDSRRGLVSRGAM